MYYIEHFLNTTLYNADYNIEHIILSINRSDLYL